MTGQRRSMPTREAIMHHWDDDPRMAGCFLETCWHCGYFELPHLERCHIVPKHCGGSDDVSNLHLLCKRCHQVSEHLQGDEYWAWFTAGNPHPFRPDSPNLELLRRGLKSVDLLHTLGFISDSTLAQVKSTSWPQVTSGQF